MSTQNKKCANDARANPEKFAGSIFRPAPKIGGVGIPGVNKDGGAASGRRPAIQHAGSSSRVAPSITAGPGSQGCMGAPKPLAGAKRPKNGSCNAVVRHQKGQVQIHGSLDEPNT